jgi:calcium permeable stress-gated cation channel
MQEGVSSEAQDGGQVAVPQSQDGEENPWRSHLRSRSDASQNIRPRLEYDDASGIIMLPDGEWLEDSDEDYSSSPGEGPTRAGSSSSALADTEHDDYGATTDTPGSPKKNRYSTYYHHPERRRTIPGAFPTSQGL